MICQTLPITNGQSQGATPSKSILVTSKTLAKRPKNRDLGQSRFGARIKSLRYKKALRRFRRNNYPNDSKSTGIPVLMPRCKPIIRFQIQCLLGRSLTQVIAGDQDTAQSALGPNACRCLWLNRLHGDPPKGLGYESLGSSQTRLA